MRASLALTRTGQNGRKAVAAAPSQREGEGWSRRMAFYSTMERGGAGTTPSCPAQYPSPMAPGLARSLECHRCRFDDGRRRVRFFDALSSGPPCSGIRALTGYPNLAGVCPTFLRGFFLISSDQRWWKESHKGASATRVARYLGRLPRRRKARAIASQDDTQIGASSCPYQSVHC
jgi:hypothetical protein